MIAILVDLDGYVLKHAMLVWRIFFSNKTSDETSLKTRFLAEFPHLAVGLNKQSVAMRLVDLRNGDWGVPKSGVENSACLYVGTQIFQAKFDI